MFHETHTARPGWYRDNGQTDAPRGCGIWGGSVLNIQYQAEMSGSAAGWAWWAPTTGSVLCSRAPEGEPWVLGQLRAYLYDHCPINGEVGSDREALWVGLCYGSGVTAQRCLKGLGAWRCHGWHLLLALQEFQMGESSTLGMHFSGTAFIT